uniref:Endonuclease VIII-like 1 DNA binding domain-containing protein n=1 Tax=Chrysemys picta bellii TaxID=8478 RepID=A0A8C3HC50_CHRPI
MPEGPELHLASCYINTVCAGLIFSGKVEKSEVSKNPEVLFESDAPHRALCFVDIRRFGRWEVHGTWQLDRGPCVMLEYEKFRENVLRNLSDKAFNKPICEALLNQKFFNGIGNYLRAEILYRLKIPPFEKARTVLEALQHRKQSPDLTLSKKVKLKRENPDLLELCHAVPMEVIHMGGKGYSPEPSDDAAAFEEWLQCYCVPGMRSLHDGNGRTIWFQGEPGPMAPKGEHQLYSSMLCRVLLLLVGLGEAGRSVACCGIIKVKETSDALLKL